MYLYVDKFDYCINNLNNEDIEEEAEAIEEKLKGIEENSILFYKNIKNKIKKEETQIYTLIGKTIDLNSSEVIQNRFDNLANQIFTLQMKQFSESIWNIKKDLKNNTYIIGFDSNENIECITLNHSQYKEFLKYRDPLNSVSVYDLFQEKIFSYYNGSTGTGKVERGRGVPSPIGKEITIIEKKKRGRKPKKKLLLVPDDQSTYIPDEALPESDSPIKKKRGRKKKVEIKRENSEIFLLRFLRSLALIIFSPFLSRLLERVASESTIGSEYLFTKSTPSEENESSSFVIGSFIVILTSVLFK